MPSARLPATLIDGDLETVIGNIRAFDIGVTQLKFLAVPQEVPYEVANGNESQDVTICGDKPARYVGIMKCESKPSDAYLVSDSFSPCVPVIAMERTQTSLAHCWGNVMIPRFSAKWDRADASIIVVAKKRNAQQLQAAEAIFQMLKNDFQYVSVCELSTDCMIGVVVRGDTILAYNQRIQHI